MRVLIVSENNTEGARLRELLAHEGVDCPSGHAVPLELSADRASRVLPHLVIVRLPIDAPKGLEAIRETRHTIPGVCMLVVGPANDPKLILNALHDGGDEFLDEANLGPDLGAALQRFRSRETSVPERKETGRVIAVLGPSGGSGASTVAANVSASLAACHGECGLFDLRLSAGDLAAMLDLKPTHSIADLCDHLPRLDQSMFEQFFLRHRSGVRLLPAPGDYGDIERVTSKGVRRALAMARVRFPYVVVDLEHSFATEQVEALWQSDVILLVLRLDYTAVRNTRRVIDNLMELGLNRERLRLVVNGYGERKQLGVAQAAAALGMEITHLIPNDPASVNLAINKGVPVVLYYPRSKVARKLQELAMSVNGASHRGS